jgi:HEAT repeat protein
MSDETDISSHAKLIQLTNYVKDMFNKKGLRAICLQLGIDHENLPGVTKDEFARELVRYCERHGQTAELEAIIAQSTANRRDKLSEHRQRVLVETRFLELKGIPLPVRRDGLPRDPHIPLDDIYIRLRTIVKEKREQQEKEEERLFGSVLQQGGSLDFLKPMQQLAEYYYRRDKVYKSKIYSDSIDPEKAITEHQRFVTLGAPGSGKSTMLRFLARRAAEDSNQPLPILISLRDYATALTQDPQLSLQRYAINQTALSDDTLREALEHAIETGKVLWLLDALDEAHNWAEEAARQASKLPGQLILTSRPLGYVGAGLYSLPHFEILPLSPDDIDSFLHDWFRLLDDETNETPVEITAQVERLQAELSSRPRLQTLTGNPLLLTFLVTLVKNKEKPDLPSQRAQLYARYVDELLTWELNRRQVLGIQKEQWQLGSARGEQARRAARDGFHYLGWILHLAYHGGQGQVVPDKPLLVDTLSNYLKQDGYPEPTNLAEAIFTFWQTAGMLDEWQIGNHKYLAYRHLTFQEYAAAWGLNRAWEKDGSNAWQFLFPRLHHYAWHEPILILMELMSGENQSQFIRRLLRNPSPNDRILHRNLQLAAALLSESAVDDDKLKRKIVDRIGQLATRTYNFSRLHKLALWLGYTSLGRKHLLVTLESIGDDVAVTYLISALNDGDSSVRDAAARALGNTGNKVAIPNLITALNDEDLWVREFTLLALGQIGKTTDGFNLVGKAISRALEDKDAIVRKTAVNVLGEFGEVVAQDLTCVSSLVRTLGDQSEDVRGHVSIALGKIEKAIIPHIVSALDNDKWEVRSSAALALGEIKDETSVNILIQTLNDHDEEVQASATFALGQLGAIAMSELISALGSSEPNVRMHSAFALGRIGQIAVPALLPALEVDDKNVRASVAMALSHIGGASTITALIKALSDKDEDVRIAAAYALGQCGEEAIPDLIDALESSVEGRALIVNVLEQIGKHSIPYLIIALGDENENVRTTAALALGQIKEKETISALLQVLNDEERETQVLLAIYALAQIGDTAISEIVNILSNTTYSEKTAIFVVALQQIIEFKTKSGDNHVNENKISLDSEPETRVLSLLNTIKVSGELASVSEIVSSWNIEDADIKFLIDVLEDDDMALRLSAVKVFGVIELPVSMLEIVISSLIRALDDSEVSVCWAIGRTLEQIGALTIPHLTDAIYDKNINRRKFVARALLWIGNPETVPHLITALGDDDPDVFQAAASALGKNWRRKGNSPSHSIVEQP